MRVAHGSIDQRQALNRAQQLRVVQQVYEVLRMYEWHRLPEDSVLRLPAKRAQVTAVGLVINACRQRSRSARLKDRILGFEG